MSGASGLPRDTAAGSRHAARDSGQRHPCARSSRLRHPPDAVKRGAQPGEQIREGIPEVAILAFAEAVPRHVDMAPEVTFVRIETCDPAAFVRREKLLDDRAAVSVKLPGQAGLVIRGDAGFGGSGSGIAEPIAERESWAPLSAYVRARAGRWISRLQGTQKRAGDLHLCDPRANPRHSCRAGGVPGSVYGTATIAACCIADPLFRGAAGSSPAAGFVPEAIRYGAPVLDCVAVARNDDALPEGRDAAR